MQSITPATNHLEQHTAKALEDICLRTEGTEILVTVRNHPPSQTLDPI